MKKGQANTQKKRKQKANLKHKVERKGIKRSAGMQKTHKSSGLPEVSLEEFSDEQMRLWICHGVNCIVSDYDKGVWKPLFEGIYEGRVPEPEDIAQMVMDKYNLKEGEWPPEAKSALAWTVQERNVVFLYYKEALRRLTAAHGGDADIEGLSRQPHNPIVWALFAYMKEKILKRK